MAARRPGLVAKQIMVKAKGGVHKRTYWVRPAVSGPQKTTGNHPRDSANDKLERAINGNEPVYKPKKELLVKEEKSYQKRHKASTIRVSHMGNTGPGGKKEWHASVDGGLAMKGFTSKKAAEAAAVAIIDKQHAERAKQMPGSMAEAAKRYIGTVAVKTKNGWVNHANKEAAHSMHGKNAEIVEIKDGPTAASYLGGFGKFTK